jgi:hypothetical protein
VVACLRLVADGPRPKPEQCGAGRLGLHDPLLQRTVHSA